MAYGQRAGSDPSPELEAEYKQAVSAAVAEFSAGHWEEARALFTQAHRANPSARTLRGLGMTAFELRNYVEARQMLSQALVSKVHPLTASQRERTASLLERTNGFVGIFTIQAPVGTAITVDEGPASLDDEGRILLNGGRHVVEAKLQGFPVERRDIDVRGGEVGTLIFEFLQPLAPAQPPADVAPPGSVTVTPLPETTHWSAAVGSADSQQPTATGGTSKVWPWVLIGTGGALFATGMLTGLMARSALNKVEDACGDSPLRCPARNESDAERADRLALTTDLLWVSGAVIGVAGVAWLWLAQDDDEDGARGGVALGVGPVALQLKGAF